MNMNAQRKYDARVKSKEIKNAMENSLNGSQIMQLRSYTYQSHTRSESSDE